MFENELHQEMFLGYGGCRAPMAPVPSFLPGYLPETRMVENPTHPAQVRGMVGIIIGFA